MPLYEYRCQRCDEVFEVIQRFSDDPLTVHEKCGGTVERLLSPPALQFKGTGWYVTDYAKSGSNGSSKPEKKSEAKSSESKSSETKTSETKSESSKPASSTSSDE